MFAYTEKAKIYPLISRAETYDYRAIYLVVACLVYAVFGSPTPDNIGVSEAVIALFLMLSIGVARFGDVLLGAYDTKFWKSSGRAFLIYGLTVPVLVGVFLGHGFGALLRDLIPFTFLFLPLLLLPLIRAKPQYFLSTVFVVVIIGFLFSLRSLVMRLSNTCSIWCTQELLYLENMPTVLFACLLMIGAAMTLLMRGLNLASVFGSVALISLSLIPIAAMAVTLQRASLGAVALYIILLCGYFFYKSPSRFLGLLIVFLAVAVFLNISVSSLYFSLWDKTQAVGFNNRPQELQAVWDIVTTDPFVFLFGIGWGGHFNSPAVGGLNVNFTHNFFTTILLKTGFVGVIFCSAYIAGLLERLSRVIIRNPVFGLALAAPILIDLTLYASFKSLDFGLMLLMICGSLVYFRQSESVQ